MGTLQMWQVWTVLLEQSGIPLSNDSSCLKLASALVLAADSEVAPSLLSVTLSGSHYPPPPPIAPVSMC